MKRLNSDGFEHVGLLVVVLVIAAVSFAGYRVWQNQQDSTSSETATNSQPLTTTNDLEDTSSTLDTTATDLDQSLDTSSLDSDINSML